jgi:uncharacterized membrane protein
VDDELLLSEEAIRRRIISVRLDYENGKIDEEEYSRINKDLRERLLTAGKE